MSTLPHQEGAQAEALAEAGRRSRRVEVNGIRRLAIADITETDLASGSVDAVITDPPYAEVDLPLYDELARFAMRVLKPGGWCLTMAGDLYLRRILTPRYERLRALMSGERPISRRARHPIVACHVTKNCARRHRRERTC